MAAGKAHMEHYKQVADIVTAAASNPVLQVLHSDRSVLPGRNAYLVYPVGQKTWSGCGTRRTGLPPPDVQEHLNQACTGNIQLKVGHTSKSGEGQ